jgi:dihydroorotate dehydrogenase (NAD+) catalytic subunit
MGGIQTWTDAAEFILAGATGLAIGTCLFVNPNIPLQICQGLEQWLTDLGCDRLEQVIGTLQMPGDPAK